jgi:predicted MFS family arabinose efflux permease
MSVPSPSSVDTTPDAASGADAPAFVSSGSKYALGLLLAIYVCNLVDRNILSIVAQPMKEDLALHDWQIGLLSGIAFALFYVIIGFPIARLAERANRVRIIAVLLVVWSVMTALCGLAQNFITLALARVGVGTGEGGCTPTSHSLIGDYFPPHKRSTAFSIYSLGIPLGPLLAGVSGGWVAQQYGWRAAFLIVALPGLLLAAIARLTLPEPARGGYDPPRTSDAAIPSFMEVLRQLASKATFRHIALGAAVATFANNGIATFAVPYLLRGFDISLSQAAASYGLIVGVAASIGVFLGGWLADRIGTRDRRAQVLIPAWGALLSAPLYVAVFLQNSLLSMALWVIAPAIIHYLYMGPTFGLTANMVDARMRATASSIVLLLMNLVGVGLGPVATGLLSDVLASHAFALGEYATQCPGGRAASDATPALVQACRSASFAGLRNGMILMSFAYVWAAAHYFLAGRTVEHDAA